MVRSLLQKQIAAHCTIVFSLMVRGALKDKSGPVKEEGGAGIVQLLPTQGFRLILSQGFTTKLDR